MAESLTEERFLELLDAGDLAALALAFENEHSVDIAAVMEELEPERRIHALSVLPVERQAAVFGYFEPQCQTEIAEYLDHAQLAALMHHMSHDERADLINHLPEETTDAVLLLMAKAEREDIRRLASYPEGSAGALMTSDYAVLQPYLTVQEAIEKLRREAPQKETINRAYIIDDQRRLLGSVRLRELILNKPVTAIADIMSRNSHPLKVDDPKEYAAHQIAKYDTLALPVVDEEGRLVGIVTHDDALDVLQEEATEDFHKTGTVGKMEGSVRDASVFMMYRKRIVWLVLLVFGNLFSGAGLAYFQQTIMAYVSLLFFLPLLIGSSGNAGSQSSTLMVRALATGDVELRDWGRMLLRELAVAIGLGLTMAAAVSLIGIWRAGMEVAVVVSLTMIAVVLVGSLIGMSLPFLLSRLKLDPATASAPLIASMADIIGVVIYFTIARVMLGG